jgi:poly(3-hydroxyalkanoate) synthetase
MGSSLKKDLYIGTKQLQIALEAAREIYMLCAKWDFSHRLCINCFVMVIQNLYAKSAIHASIPNVQEKKGFFILHRSQLSDRDAIDSVSHVP